MSMSKATQNGHLNHGRLKFQQLKQLCTNKEFNAFVKMNDSNNFKSLMIYKIALEDQNHF